MTIRVVARSENEMSQYIATLAAQLGRASEPEVRTQLIQRLMYTADRRAAQPLLDISDHDDNTSFWIGEAFSYYLPKDRALLDDAMATIRRHGVSPSSVRILEQLQAPRETIKGLIGPSLNDANDGVRSEAALAAQNYPDDRFMERLIQLAMQGSAGTRVRAIYALVSNRTDAGIAALRRLRQDADPEIRTTTERAIEGGYRMSGTGRGRPLQMHDFPDLAKR